MLSTINAENQDTVREEIYAYRVTLVRERKKPWKGESVSSSRDAARLFRFFIGDVDREHFVVAFLDAKHTVIGVNVVSVGSLSASIVHPREVFKGAILSNSAALILGHNHPSGRPEPSPEDIQITKRLREAGETLGIRVLDHVILGDGTDETFSFADAGYL